jgi:hypothetical protein
MDENAPSTGKRAAGLSNRGGEETTPSPRAFGSHSEKQQPSYAWPGRRAQEHRASSVLLRSARSVAAPIKPIVDPPLHHLNVAVAPGKRVAGEEWGTSWNNKCPILQP